MKIYKVKRSFIIGNSVILLFPLIMSLTIFLETDGMQKNELFGVLVFWIVGLLIVIVPLGARLVVGGDFVRTYLFGVVTTNKISKSEIQSMVYGNVFYGGLGLGKGLNFRVSKKSGKSKAYSLSEKMYGKEAIEYARQVLTK